MNDLKALRKGRAMTREDLALAASVSPAWLQRLEAHTAALTPQVAERLAPYLGVSAEALLAIHAAGRERRRAELAALRAVGV